MDFLLEAYDEIQRELKSGLLVIDKARVTAEAKLDGKYLVSTSDDELGAEAIAVGYKQIDTPYLHDEPPRVLRRVHSLRGWSSWELRFGMHRR